MSSDQFEYLKQRVGDFVMSQDGYDSRVLSYRL
jgi:hypothetical protein